MKKRTTTCWLVVVGFVLTVLWGCTDDGSGSGPCNAGTTRDCVCLNGASGRQACQVNQVFGPCQCGQTNGDDGGGNPFSRRHDGAYPEEPPQETIEWIAIESGEFAMGSTRGSSNERPVHDVTVSSFEMSKTEVTVFQYGRCIERGGCNEAPGVSDGCNWEVNGRSNHPVNCVSWTQAREFCEWAEGRLPSEAEWEYAARSEGRNQEYPWGDEHPSCERAVMSDGGSGCGENRTWAVCSKPRGNTAQRLCDMAGNVWEWVEDVYLDSYDNAPPDGSARVAGGSDRVRRGGSFGYAVALRGADRSYAPPGLADVYLGFRCARLSL